MKVLSGVLSGLIIGAALVFATLAVLGIVANDAACTQQAPAGWSVRVDVPGQQLQDRVGGQLIVLGSATYAVTSVSVADCGGVLVTGTLAVPGGFSLNSVGMELSLRLEGDGLALRPSKLWFGRLPVDLRWSPEEWWQGLVPEVDPQLSSIVASGTGQAGMAPCGIAGGNGSLSLYLCEIDASTTQATQR